MDRELVEKFIEVTGASEAIAAQYLAVADGNVETAISLMFEAGGTSGDGEVASTEPEIRAPILPTQEVLVPTEAVCSFPRASNSVFDRFRDFAVETQRQEEEMTRRVTGVKKMSPRKSKRLEDLYRPPCDILFLGSFMEAREHAKTVNRWLLVNVQNPLEFSCQILNRDLWPNEQIREIVKDHFVLWQVISNTADGQRYIDFYNVSEYPYLAVLDPRTGECMRMYNHMTVDSLAAGLNDMLSTHASPESAPQDPSSASDDWLSCSVASLKRRSTPPDSLVSDSSSSSKKSRESEEPLVDSGATVSNASLPCSSTGILSKRSRIDELDSKKRGVLHNFLSKKRRLTVSDSESESEASPIVQLYLYDTYQLTDSPSNSPVLSGCFAGEHLHQPQFSLGSEVTANETDSILQLSSLDILKIQDEQLNKTQTNLNETDLNDEPSLRLCLRLPNGGKEALSMGASDTIEQFLRRMEDMGFPPSEHTYLVPFPRTNVGALSPQTRLSDTILFPSNTVFITKI